MKLHNCFDFLLPIILSQHSVLHVFLLISLYMKACQTLLLLSINIRFLIEIDLSWFKVSVSPSIFEAYKGIGFTFSCNSSHNLIDLAPPNLSIYT